jgi:hypothetical protein
VVYDGSDIPDAPNTWGAIRHECEAKVRALNPVMI